MSQIQKQIYILPLFIIYIICQNNGDIRLYGQTDKIIEMYQNNEWLPICDTLVSDDEANAACKSMGFDRHNGFRIQQSCSGSYYATINELDDIGNNFGIDFSQTLGCQDSDSNFNACVQRLNLQWKNTNCQNNDCWELECENIPITEQADIILYGTPTGIHRVGDIQIKTSKNLLFYFTGEFWDPICKESFNQEAADLICKKEGKSQGDYKASTCETPDEPGYRQNNFQKISCGTFGNDNIQDCNFLTASCSFLSTDCISIKCEGSITDDISLDGITDALEDASPTAIIIGAVVFLIFTVVIVLFIMKRKKQQQLKIQELQKNKNEQALQQQQNNNNNGQNQLNGSAYKVQNQNQQQIINSQQPMAMQMQYNQNPQQMQYQNQPMPYPQQQQQQPPSYQVYQNSPQQYMQMQQPQNTNQQQQYQQQNQMYMQPNNQVVYQNNENQQQF